MTELESQVMIPPESDEKVTPEKSKLEFTISLLYLGLSPQHVATVLLRTTLDSTTKIVNTPAVIAASFVAHKVSA